MWPRVGGHVGPPTPLTPEVDRFELMPWRSSPPEDARTGNALTHYQQPLQIPLEPHVRNSSRRSYQRIYIQHPYRLLSLSELMSSYTPISPALQEEESTGHGSNVEVEERPRVVKRANRLYPTFAERETSGVQRMPDNYRIRQSHWRQADAPEIIITSDVQLQTDDDETGYNSTILSSPRQSSSSDFSESSPHDYGSSTTQTEIIINTGNESLPELGAAYVDVESSSYPPNNSTENHVPQHTENFSSSKESVIANQAAFNKSLEILTTASTGPVKLALRSLLKARQVANSVIKHARNHRTINEKLLHCLNCNLLPILPVTGLCGHTRCTRCIERHGDCPCGVVAPKDLHVNSVVQYLLEKMLHSPMRRNSRREIHAISYYGPLVTEELSGPEAESAAWSSLQPAPLDPELARVRSRGADVYARVPMSPQVQFEYARRLVAAGRLRDAAPHFARVAASSAQRARAARNMLAQVIMLLNEDGVDGRHLTRELFRSVRLQAASHWLRPSDLECVLCFNTYSRPVTTPCGHTYCRTCIERAMDYRKFCALCSHSLDDFDLTATRETEFVLAALESIGALRAAAPQDPDVIPIFVCTVAYPSIPCPLFIFDPRYRLMIRRVLESGSRRFGMLAFEKGPYYSEYGTILEVRDCVYLEDGRSILSTVGVSRFKVLERDVSDGCDVARIEPLVDMIPMEEDPIMDMRYLGSLVLYKALLWLSSMKKSLRSEIETAFGEIPRYYDAHEDWWTSPDGPAWLWWLVTILPLRPEIKVLILSTKNLGKRMLAVSRTLDAIDQVAITTTSTSECEIRSALTNAEEWLERGS